MERALGDQLVSLAKLIFTEKVEFKIPLPANTTCGRERRGIAPVEKSQGPPSASVLAHFLHW